MFRVSSGSRVFGAILPHSPCRANGHATMQEDANLSLSPEEIWRSGLPGSGFQGDPGINGAG